MLIEGKLKDRLLARLDAAVLAWALAHGMKGVRVLHTALDNGRTLETPEGETPGCVVTLFVAEVESPVQEQTP